MSCSNPLTAIDLGIDPQTGKRRIKIKRPHLNESLEDFRRRFGDRVVLLPCGHCDSCRLEYRREWAIRCALESKQYLNNCFVTLTYDRKHLPKDNKLVKSDLQKFYKALRNKGYKIRYFGCGEYGEKSARPHYHTILFGYMPDDLVYSHESDSNEHIYTSKIIDECWSKGLCSVQMFTPATAGYVAGYTNKKVLDDRGFILMSKKPGIGFQYLEDNFHDIYSYDLIVDDLGSYKMAKPFRYFDKLVDGSVLYELEPLKEARRVRANNVKAFEWFTHHYYREEEILQANALQSAHKMAKLKRGL